MTYEYMTDKHEVAARTLPKISIVGGAGVVSSSVACYISKYVGSDHYAALFNYTIEKDRFFLNGIPTTAWIAKGDSFTDCKLYEESVEHSLSFVYDDMEFYGIDMLIREVDTGWCESFDQAFCNATSKIKSFGTVGTYLWTVEGATLSLGQGTDEITVDTTGTENTEYTVTLTTTLMGHTETITRVYQHNRKQTWTPIVINSLTETVGGYCDFTSPGSCATTSTHVVDYSGAVEKISWVIPSWATVVSGRTTDTLVILSDGTDSLAGLVKVNLSGYGYLESAEQTVLHTRLDLYIPMQITELTEEVVGACDFFGVNTCVAESTHKVAYLGIPTEIIWVVTGATIVSGQGTDTLVVSTDGQADSSFTLDCQIIDLLTSDNVTGNYSHIRTEIFEEFDQVLLYNNTNIATEFIA